MTKRQSAAMTERLSERINYECNTLAMALGAVVAEMAECGSEFDKLMAEKLDAVVDQQRADDKAKGLIRS